MQFKLQQAYIAQELCVSREVPMNGCNGKCYLKSHLQKEDNGSGFSISYLKEKAELYFSESVFLKNTRVFYVNVAYPRITFENTIQKSNEIFHPPA